MGRATELLQRIRGISTRSVERVVNVGLTATPVMRNDPDRIEYIIINNTVNRAVAWWDSTVSLTHGIPLEANGGQIQLLIEEDGERVGRELWMVMQTAVGNVDVAEEIAQ